MHITFFQSGLLYITSHKMSAGKHLQCALFNSQENWLDKQQMQQERKNAYRCAKLSKFKPKFLVKLR